MRSFLQAAQIMWTLHTEKTSGNRSCHAEEIVLSGTAGNCGSAIAVDVYEPHVRCLGTIAVVHGMAPKGKNDPRVVALCQAFSHAGYRVLAPDIESIRSLCIDAEQINLIGEMLAAFAENNAWCPSGRLSVLAPSFSGAMCLAAAALPQVEEKIISVCAIGAFTHVESVMAYLLTDSTSDPYGRYIVLKKIIPLVTDAEVVEHRSSLEQAIEAVIQDNLNQTASLYANQQMLDRCLATMNRREKDMVARVLNDVSFRAKMFESAKIAMADELRQLDIISRIDRLSAKVLLLHGRHDNVIPSHQSEIMHSRLKEMQKCANLVVTPFISHGDASFNIGLVPEVIKIVKGFAYFFRDLKAI